MPAEVWQVANAINIKKLIWRPFTEGLIDGAAGKAEGNYGQGKTQDEEPTEGPDLGSEEFGLWSKYCVKLEFGVRLNKTHV